MSYWIVVKAVPGHDRIAVAGVTIAGFETFAPKTRTQVGARWRTVGLLWPSVRLPRSQGRSH
jgi:hypothetical protein